ncbi:hypothetical protein [Kamptonema sp. UHCC 0994]|uniref:hypothetical protein n=1 Tax=Kamptonema sp. UHCC 0994 TaxID=3031329 RepID=UPI0023BA8085|nr:hypothetical protein [Kamptonema sp. UHCC 0994]MDF0556563.1 hypothetical protein [Kamptonema sp. UHCC 0994]
MRKISAIEENQPLQYILVSIGRAIACLRFADFYGKWQGKHGLARFRYSSVSKQQAHK